MLVRALALASLVLGFAVCALAEEEPEEDPCAGRNPLYCSSEAEDGKAPAPAPAAGGDDLEPPGACEGRNPLYCQEQAPAAAPPAPAEPERTGGVAPSSRNPRRNPSPNPDENPRRNPNRYPDRSSTND
jgi:hypothetical protein